MPQNQLVKRIYALARNVGKLDLDMGLSVLAMVPAAAHCFQYASKQFSSYPPKLR